MSASQGRRAASRYPELPSTSHIGAWGRDWTVRAGQTSWKLDFPGLDAASMDLAGFMRSQVVANQEIGRGEVAVQWAVSAARSFEKLGTGQLLRAEAMLELIRGIS